MKKLKNIIVLCFSFFLAFCSPQTNSTKPVVKENKNQKKVIKTLWEGITYEIFIQSFCDSNGDGIGDIQGMISKLDYLEELGIEAVWLMPIHPSPSYHKYDVLDYKAIHPDYGTMDDFKEFVQKAHQKGIKVIIDLVLNHTSSQHPWFKEASKGKSSPYRNYYVWDDIKAVKQRIEHKEIKYDTDDISQWHNLEGRQKDEYYYGFFWVGMPDLNYDNPKVREEVFEIGRFWLEEVGIDGFRLDAAKYIYPEDRAEDNHQWWAKFREEMRKINPKVFLVGEVWAEVKIATPFLQGLDAVFNFDLSYAILDAVKSENGKEFIETYENIYSYYKPFEGGYTDATFLTNHDQNRVKSELEANIKKSEIAANLLFTLPGNPFIYYGEELGMEGMKPDENIREPFLWKTKEEDNGRTSWIKPVYSTDEKVSPLTIQQSNKNSMFNYYKKWISLRKSNEVLSKGAIEFVTTKSSQLIAFFRKYGGDKVFIIHNLSDDIEELSTSDFPFQSILFSTSSKSKITSNTTISIAPNSCFILK